MQKTSGHKEYLYNIVEKQILVRPEVVAGAAATKIVGGVEFLLVLGHCLAHSFLIKYTATISVPKWHQILHVMNGCIRVSIPQHPDFSLASVRSADLKS